MINSTIYCIIDTKTDIITYIIKRAIYTLGFTIYKHYTNDIHFSVYDILCSYHEGLATKTDGFSHTSFKSIINFCYQL